MSTILGKVLARSCGTRSSGQCPQHMGETPARQWIRLPGRCPRRDIKPSTKRGVLESKKRGSQPLPGSRNGAQQVSLCALCGYVSYWCGTVACLETLLAARLLRPAMKATTATTTTAPAPTPAHPHTGNPPEIDDDTPDLPLEESVGSLREVELCGVRSLLAETIEPPRERKSRLFIVTFLPFIFPWVDLMIFPGIVINICVLKPLESPLLLR